MKIFTAFSVINLVKAFILLTILFKAANLYAFEYQTHPYFFLPEVVHTEQLLEIENFDTSKLHSIGDLFISHIKKAKGSKLPSFWDVIDKKLYERLINYYINQEKPLYKAARIDSFLTRPLKNNILHQNSEDGDTAFHSEVA